MAVSSKGWIKGKTWAFVRERTAILLANRGRRDNLYAIDTALAGEDITQLEEYKEADVIHLHWVNQGFLSFQTLQKIIDSGKRIVWTMHDAWNMTGICHLTLGCEAYRNECGNCTSFCPYAAQPCKDKFTLFQTERDMEDSRNFGFCFLKNGKVRVRLGKTEDYDLDLPNELPKDIELLICTVRDRYAYLF